MAVGGQKSLKETVELDVTHICHFWYLDVDLLYFQEWML